MAIAISGTATLPSPGTPVFEIPTQNADSATAIHVTADHSGKPMISSLKRKIRVEGQVRTVNRAFKKSNLFPRTRGSFPENGKLHASLGHVYARIQEKAEEPQERPGQAEKTGGLNTGQASFAFWHETC